MFLSNTDENTTIEEPDEKVLVLSIENPKYFEILVDRYQIAFLRKAQSILGRREFAEDAVQDTFVKIYRYADKFEVQEGAKFSSWAYRILINTSFTHYQKLKRRREMDGPLPEEFQEFIADPKGQALFSEHETSEYVFSILKRMPSHMQSLLKEYFIEGKSQKEIAQKEGVSVGAVKTRMHRAKKEFKKMGFHLV